LTDVKGESEVEKTSCGALRGKFRPINLLLGSNDTVPTSLWRGGVPSGKNVTNGHCNTKV